MLKLISAGTAAASVLLAASAQAQTFPSTSTTVPTPTRSLGGGTNFTTSQPISPNDLIVLNRLLPLPGQSANGFQATTEYALLPLSAFAGSADLAALRSEMSAGVAALQADTARGFARADERASIGAALAAATDLQRPAEGSSNRLGGMVSTFRDQTAAGFGYTRQSGKVDFGVAVGLASGASMGKAGVGFSW